MPKGDPRGLAKGEDLKKRSISPSGIDTSNIFLKRRSRLTCSAKSWQEEIDDDMIRSDDIYFGSQT